MVLVTNIVEVVFKKDSEDVVTRLLHMEVLVAQVVQKWCEHATLTNVQ